MDRRETQSKVQSRALPAYVQIGGKGGRTRQCPLWPATAREIENSIAKRQPHEHVFLTRLLQPYTRVGIMSWRDQPSLMEFLRTLKRAKAERYVVVAGHDPCYNRPAYVLRPHNYEGNIAGRLVGFFPLAIGRLVNEQELDDMRRPDFCRAHWMTI